MKENLVPVELTDEHQSVLNAMVNYNNYLFISDGNAGNNTIVMHATSYVIERGIKELCKNDNFKKLLTDIIIDVNR